MTTFVRCVLVVVSAAVGTVAQSGLDYRVFDIGGVVAPVEDTPVSGWSLPLRRAYAADRGDSFEPSVGVEPAPTLAPDLLVSLIRDAVHPSSWNEDGRSMWLAGDGSRLIVRQTPDVLSDVQAVLDALARILRRSIAIEALVVEGDSAALAGLVSGGAVLDATQFDAVRAGRTKGLTVLDSLLGAASDGQRVRLGNGTHASFVGRCGVEVATSAQVSDPAIIRVFTGAEVHLRVTVLPDGRINLRAQVELSHDLELVDFEARTAGVCRLQLPTLRVQKVTATGIVPNGGALVLGSVAGGRASRFLILRASAPDAEELAPLLSGRTSLALHRVSPLTEPYLAVPRLSLGPVSGGAGLRDEPAPEPAAFTGGGRFMSRDELVDLVRRVVTPRYWEEHLYQLEESGGWLWVNAAAEQRKAIQGLVHRLGGERARPLSVEAYVISMKRDALGALRADGQDWPRRLLRAPTGYRRFSAITATEPGGRVEWALGTEYAYLADFDPEIAQGAEMAEPEIETAFGGLYLRLAPYSLGPKQLGLHFHAELVDEGARPSSFDLGTPPGGIVQVPRVRGGRIAGHTVVAEGQHAVLGEFGSPFDPEEVAVIVVRLRGAD